MQMTTFRRLAFSTALALSFSGITTQALAGTVFTVQLGSFESEKEARSHWDKLQNRFPDIFEPLNYASAKVQLPPDDFVYFRTQAGPIDKRSEADEICRRLVVKGFECYVAETAMFMADGDTITEEHAEAEAAAEPPAPPPLPSTPPLPRPEQIAATPEDQLVDMLEASETPPAAPMPAPEKPEPIVKVASQPPVAKTSAAPVARPNSSLPWSGTPSAGTQASAAQQTPASMPINGGPFQSGESTWARNGERTPVTTYVRQAPPPVASVNVPTVPVSATEDASLKVAEAVPVPLGNIPPAPVISGYTPSTERGLPSEQIRRPSLWAEISYFTSQQAALNYWSTLRTRDMTVPQGLRLRVVKPLRQTAGAQRLSLRIGPFDNTNAIRRLCSYTAPEKLRCQGMRDVGSSISYAERRQQLLAHRSSGVGAASSSQGDFSWVQLGAFASREIAQSHWSMLKSAHPAHLAKASYQIMAPTYSSASRPMYRLRVGPYTNGADANNLCNALQRAGSACLVVSGK